MDNPQEDFYEVICQCGRKIRMQMLRVAYCACRRQSVYIPEGSEVDMETIGTLPLPHPN